VESVLWHLDSRYKIDVWIPYDDICTQGIRMMGGVCMDTFVHQLSVWCLVSVKWHLYTRYPIDEWSLYGHIFTPVVRLIWWVCIVTSVHKISDTCVESVRRHICTQGIRLMFGVSMDTSVHNISDWLVESACTKNYTSFQTDVWSLYSYICNLDIRLMPGVCI
jgi:hypothetical protein